MNYYSTVLIIFLSFCIQCNAKMKMSSDHSFDSFCTSCIPVAKDNDSFTFRYLTSKDGFAGNAIFQTIQARNGDIWFATWYGLYQYDGFHLWPVCRTELEKRKIGCIVTNILEDSRHRIWAKTIKGLVIWNPAEKRIDSLDFSHFHVDDIPQRIRTFCLDDQQNIWMSGYGVLCKYDQHTDKVTDYSSLLSDNDFNVLRLYLDKENRLWVMTFHHGLMKLELNRSNVSSNDSSSEYRLVKDTVFSSQNKEMRVLVMYQDNQKNYWFATTEGLFYVRKKSDKPDCWETRCFEYKAPSEEKMIVRAFTQRGENVFAATSNGLFCYSLQKHTPLLITQHESQQMGLNCNSLYDVFIDRENGMWISSFSGGINYSSPTACDLNYR